MTKGESNIMLGEDDGGKDYKDVDTRVRHLQALLKEKGGGRAVYWTNETAPRAARRGGTKPGLGLVIHGLTDPDDEELLKRILRIDLCRAIVETGGPME